MLEQLRTPGSVPCRAAIPLLVICLFTAASASGVTARTAKQYHTTFATINYSNDDDLFRFTRKLGTGLGSLTENFKKDPRLTARRVDALVMRVMTLLGMGMPHLHFSVTVLSDPSGIREAYAMFPNGDGAPVAYYDHANNTIFLSAGQVNGRILAHEIAHAVLCAWFDSSLTANAQEILATYVEQHLEDKD